jgi:hypothetical protein
VEHFPLTSARRGLLRLLVVVGLVASVPLVAAVVVELIQKAPIQMGTLRFHLLKPITVILAA